MDISIKNPDAENLVREMVEITGESMTQAMIAALQERRQRLAGRRVAVSQEESWRLPRPVRHCPTWTPVPQTRFLATIHSGLGQMLIDSSAIPVEVIGLGWDS